jgi:hypothetical protein
MESWNTVRARHRDLCKDSSTELVRLRKCVSSGARDHAEISTHAPSSTAGPVFLGKVHVDDYADSSVPSVFWFPADIAAFSAGFAELPEGKESKVLDGLSEFLDDVSVS